MQKSFWFFKVTAAVASIAASVAFEQKMGE